MTVQPAMPDDATAAGARPARFDAHMHTDLSPDSTSRSTTTRQAALEHGIAEIAITDHVDFEPGAPAFGYATFEDRERDRPRRGGALGAARASRSGSGSS